MLTHDFLYHGTIVCPKLGILEAWGLFGYESWAVHKEIRYMYNTNLKAHMHIFILSRSFRFVFYTDPSKTIVILAEVYLLSFWAICKTVSHVFA